MGSATSNPPLLSRDMRTYARYACVSCVIFIVDGMHVSCWQKKSYGARAASNTGRTVGGRVYTVPEPGAEAAALPGRPRCAEGKWRSGLPSGRLPTTPSPGWPPTRASPSRSSAGSTTPRTTSLRPPTTTAEPPAAAQPAPPIQPPSTTLNRCGPNRRLRQNGACERGPPL